MVRLSDYQLSQLLDELSHGMAIDLPLADVAERLGDRRLGRVGVAAKQIANQLRSGVPAQQALSIISSPMSEAACAAVDVSMQSGDATMLARFARRLSERSTMRRISNVAWFYPIVLIAIAYATALFVISPLTSEDDVLEIAWPDWLVDSCRWITANPWIPVFVFVVAVIAIRWIVRSRSSFVHPVSCSLFCRTLADQIGDGVEEESAVRIASELAGISNMLEPGRSGMKSLMVQDILEPAGDFDQSELDQPSPELLQAKLRYLGQHYDQKAVIQHRFWTRWLPQAFTLTLGFIYLLGYAWFVIAPIYRRLM